MTAFEKSLRTLDEKALRAGAVELLSILAEVDGTRRRRGGPAAIGGWKRRGGAAVYAPDAGGVLPEAGPGSEAETVPGGDTPVPGGEAPEGARARRAVPGTDSGPAARETAREDADLPETDFPGDVDGEDRRARKSQKDHEARKDWEDREVEKKPEDWKDREKSEDRRARESRGEDREDQENREERTRTLHEEDGETVDRAETRALERQLQSVGTRRRSTLRESDGDGESGARTAAFREAERHYEGTAGARSMEMRRISDYFRRDSRRYDTGFTRY